MRYLTFGLLLILAACGSEEVEPSESFGDLSDMVDESVEAVRAEVANLRDPSVRQDEIHNDYAGAYRLQSAFRGEGECLDANYHDADTDHGGAFMAPCSGSDDQTWRFTPVDDPYHFQIWTEHNGEKLCLDGNDRNSPIHDGAAFVEPCRLIAGQIWTITSEDNGFVRLHTEYEQQADCFESNQAGSPAHSGASYMDSCQNVTGQLWRLVRVDAPPA